MSLDQNLHRLLSEKWTYRPVVKNESESAGYRSDVDSEGQLVIQCYTQVPCSPSRGHLTCLIHLVQNLMKTFPLKMKKE